MRRVESGGRPALVMVGAALALTLAACERRTLSPDAPEAARAAVEQCSSRSGDEKEACYETRLLAELESGSVSSALEMLEAIGSADRQVEQGGHVYTHAIGIAAYTPERPVADVFSQCSTLYQSGCYHGVIQAHFIAEGAADEAAVNELCAPYRSDEQRWLLFQCLHGLGHGLTMFYGHDLPRALEDCDYLRSSWDRESCYGGAFMENVVNVTHPHHPASALVDDGTSTGGSADDPGTSHDHGADGEEGAPTGHAHDGVPEGAEPFEALRGEDPHYPCSILDDRYLTACYMMQTSAMLWHNGNDIGKAAESCAEAPEGWRRTCFQSLGRDISSRTLQEPRPSLRECRKSPEEYREWCYVGLVKNFIDLTATTGAAFSFCRRVEAWAKPRCHEAIGEEIGILHASSAARRTACVGSETPELERSCRRGARVPLDG
ncbi:MAG: hypothetical protein MJB57_11655 [Gemmatimonadetes bacterium]|nr:hypothetical protein [Gemmatimonadota bacterium]